LTIEDVFAIQGRGTVVTGRVATGAVRVGTPVTITTASGPITSKVMGIEQFRKVMDVASAGARTSGCCSPGCPGRTPSAAMS
jgi:elongation factor Tu